MTKDRVARRREERRERRVRLEERVARLEAPPEPVVWRAGWRDRAVAAAWCVFFVSSVSRPPGSWPTRYEWDDLFFACWTSLVAAWVCCRVGAWRITAARGGVYLRRFWSVRFIPWQRIGRVELRRDGLLEFVGGAPEPLAGLFSPPWLDRLLRRRGRGGEVADLLTLMAGHSELRPAADAGRSVTGRAFVRTALPLAAVLYVVAHGFLR